MNPRPLLLVLLMLVGAGPSRASEATQPLAARPARVDQPAMLKRYGAEYITALQRGEPDRLEAFWAGDVRVMPEYHPTLFGREQARRYYQAWLAKFSVNRGSRTPIGFLDLGAQVIEIGQFTLGVGVRGEQSSSDVSGKYMEFWNRTPAGELELATIAWNFDQHHSTTDAFRFAGVPGTRQALEAHLPIEDPVTFELAALLRLHETAVVTRDHRVWAMLYADDAVLLANHQPVIAGRAAIDAHFAAYVHGLPAFEKLDLRNDRADRLGRYVIEYASHVANWRRDQQSGVNTGKAIRLWRREPHGGLRVLWSIAMYD